MSRKNREIRGIDWQVSASILLTILLLIVSCFLAIKFWHKEGDQDIYVLIVSFSIFNVLETFLSLNLLLGRATAQYNNSIKIATLINYLRREGIVRDDWLDDQLPLVRDRIEE